jgi:predicted dehydrogenase
MPAPRVVITGIGGYGRVHLENARRLEAEGRLEIAAVVDPAVPEAYDSLGEALAAHDTDVVIVATPLHTHETLASEAMRAGADVLLEKPPVPSFAEFERLLAVQRETGRAVQLGFQSLGSHAIDALRTDAYGIGAPRAVSATGLWSRTRAYWGRAPWAGRRSLHGHPVGDGVATNALAHAVATALRFAGYDTAEAVDRVEVEAFRANDIETDDTVALRVTGAGLPPVNAALTLCAPAELVERADRAAVVEVASAEASVAFSYTTDVASVRGQQYRLGRTDLLDNLLDHRENGAELIVPLVSTGAFQRVAEAIRRTTPVAIDQSHVTWHGEGDDGYPVIDGIERAVRDAGERGLLFSELGVPWAAATT